MVVVVSNDYFPSVFNFPTHWLRLAWFFVELIFYTAKIVLWKQMKRVRLTKRSIEPSSTTLMVQYQVEEKI